MPIKPRQGFNLKRQIRLHSVKEAARTAASKAAKNSPAKAPKAIAACPMAKGKGQSAIKLNKATSVVVVPLTPNAQIVAGPPMAPVSSGFESIFRAVTIGGDSTYQAKVRADLSRIYQTPTGNSLLLSIRDSGKKVGINPLSAEDAVKYGPYAQPLSNDIYRNWLGKPGKGADSTIFYDPDNSRLGLEKWFAPVAPGIVLAHELIHSDHMATGTSAQGNTDNDHKINPAYEELGNWDPRRLFEPKYQQVPREEVRTAGIPPDDAGQFTENKIRSEWQPPQTTREYY